MKLFTCAVVRPFWPTDYTQVVRFACSVSLMDIPIHGYSPLCLSVTFYKLIMCLLIMLHLSH